MNTNWLPHLSPEIVSDIKGNYLDAYVVALEGWRRGLTLKWHVKDSEKFKDMKTWYVDRPGQLFSLHSEKRSHYFFRTRGDLVPNKAVEDGMDKQKTKEILGKAKVPVPRGRSFNKDDDRDEIFRYVRELGFPVVVKPTEGSFGRGVITDISSNDELQQAIDYLFDDRLENEIIVEQFILGRDYRIYVVGNEVVGAILRLPPNVIGDGVSSISTLIDLKNKERNKNPRLMDCQIKINDELNEFINKNDYTVKSIPEKGEVVNLSNKGNVSIGGDPIGVLETLSSSVKNSAIRALQAIEGLEHGAVDIIVEQTDSGQENSYVIELNPTAQLGGIIFPYKGEPSDVPKAIIDFYFPETKEIHTEREKIYFDFSDVLEPLNSTQAVISTVSPPPVGEILMKKYIVNGDVVDIGYHLGLRKQAFERKLHGFVSVLQEDTIEIVVAGTESKPIDDFKNGILEDEERAMVTEIKEEPYTGYVNVGFDSRIINKMLIEKLANLENEIVSTNANIQQLEVTYKNLIQSNSWKVSYPIRWIGAMLKPFKVK